MKTLTLLFLIFSFPIMLASGYVVAAIPHPQVKAMLDALPRLELLESVALQHAGMEPGKIQRWERNSRRAVALPRLQIGYEQKAQQQNNTVVQDSISVTSAGVAIGPEANRLDQNFDGNRGFEIKAVWALDELLFNRDEIEISREARDLMVLRAQLQETLRQTYYDLKLQLWHFQLEPVLLEDPLEIIKTQQLMDKLNSISGGEFFRHFPADLLPKPVIPIHPVEEQHHAHKTMLSESLPTP